jgi:hypothetical protein
MDLNELLMTLAEAEGYELKKKPEPERPHDKALGLINEQLSKMVTVCASFNRRLDALEEAITAPPQLYEAPPSDVAIEGTATPKDKIHRTIRSGVQNRWKKTSLARNLYAYLRRNSLNTTDAGAALGVTQNTFSKWMAGKVSAVARVAEYYAKVTGVSVQLARRHVLAHNQANVNVDWKGKKA